MVSLVLKFDRAQLITPVLSSANFILNAGACSACALGTFSTTPNTGSSCNKCPVGSSACGAASLALFVPLRFGTGFAVAQNNATSWFVSFNSYFSPRVY